MKAVNENLDSVTISDIEEHKRLSKEELLLDLNRLKEFPASINENNFAGNNFLYHFQLKNLLQCRRENRKTIYEIAEDPTEWSKLIEQTKEKDRGGKSAAANVFECYRINNGSVVMFKATTAKYIYKKYGANRVLDPTAGWGGRLLGAWAKNISYFGIDLNHELKSAYKEMISCLENQYFYGAWSEAPEMKMLFLDSLTLDFRHLYQYDFVLTSPPYINLEIYEHMEEWKSKEIFYKDFFLPLFEKCMTETKKATICFNISPKMYDEFLSYGGMKCSEEEDLKQQLGQQTDKKRQDKVYIWFVK